jgi:hypothetical protein
VPLVLKARYHLLRRRLHSRWRRAIVWAIIAGTIFFFFTWAGGRGKFQVPTSSIPIVRCSPSISVCGRVRFCLVSVVAMASR